MGASNCIGILPENLHNLEDLISEFESDSKSHLRDPPSLFGNPSLQDSVQSVFLWRFYYKETFTKELVLDNCLVSLSKFLEQGRATQFKCLQNESMIVLILCPAHLVRHSASPSDQLLFDLFKGLGPVGDTLAQTVSFANKKETYCFLDKISFSKRLQNVDFEIQDLRNMLSGFEEDDLRFPYFESCSETEHATHVRLFTIHGLKSTEESQAQSTLYSMKLQKRLESGPLTRWLFNHVCELLFFRRPKTNETVFPDAHLDLGQSKSSTAQEALSIWDLPLMVDLLGVPRKDYEPVDTRPFECFWLNKKFFEYGGREKVHLARNLEPQICVKKPYQEKLSIKYTREESQKSRSLSKQKSSKLAPAKARTQQGKSEAGKKKSANMCKKLDKNHFKIDLSKIRTRRSHGINSDRPAQNRKKQNMESKLLMLPMNYTQRDNFARPRKDSKPLSIVKVLKKALKKPKSGKHQKFMWLMKNSEIPAKTPKNRVPKKRMHTKEQANLQNLQPAPAHSLSKPAPPVPKNTLRSREDIILRIENIRRQKLDGAHTLTERNQNLRSCSKEARPEQLDSGCLSDRSHLKKKSLFSKLTEPPQDPKEKKGKKVFTFNEELYESGNVNSFGSSRDAPRVRISFAPVDEPKPIKTSIVEGKLAPLSEVIPEKPSFVEFSTPSNSKHDKLSFDLKLDLNSLRSKKNIAKSERNWPPKTGMMPLEALDFIPERSSEHNFEGKVSRFGIS